jgi:SAM-dependent methyltransferase
MNLKRRFSAALRQRAKWRGFRRDFVSFQELSRDNGRPLELNWNERRPCLEDQTTETPFDRHYIYHTAWAARIVAQTRPLEHVDIGSALYFATLVSAFVPIRFYDYRPAAICLSGLNSGQADLLALPFADNSISSLSCMHVVEHIGLGRYGDALDPEGDVKAMSELARVVAKGGSLLFVVPVGRPRIQFNAHRIYSYAEVIKQFENCRLVQSALIPDDPAEGGLTIDPPRAQIDAQNYGCGCFWFKKDDR